MLPPVPFGKIKLQTISRFCRIGVTRARNRQNKYRLLPCRAIFMLLCVCMCLRAHAIAPYR
jgi:hypothetical protein